MIHLNQKFCYLNDPAANETARDRKRNILTNDFRAYFLHQIRDFYEPETNTTSWQNVNAVIQKQS